MNLIQNIGVFFSFTACLTGFVQAQSTFQFKGKVIDSVSGLGINKASIHILPHNKIILTDSVGQFSVLMDKQSHYTIQVTCVGYQKYGRPMSIQQLASSPRILLIPQSHQVGEVRITKKQEAPDNLIKAEYSAMPVTIISRREIELMGSRRLDEVLKEQTGMAVVNEIAGGSRAVGLQMQGFGSGYIMVLIDGQPMVGRNSGNFDLSRISVTNIERIEITKGATSSLYGSDALGGTINIITKSGQLDPQLSASVLYGSLNIVDATLEGETPVFKQKGALSLSGNYYQTDGYNSNPYLTGGTTVPPYQNYSFQGRFRYATSENSQLHLSARFAERHSTMRKDWSDNVLSEDFQRDKDFNIGAAFDAKIRANLRSMTRYYFTRYQTDMQVSWINFNAIANTASFDQQLHRLEQQFSYQPHQNLNFTGGIGGSTELMNNQDLEHNKALNSAFAFLQTAWHPVEKLKTNFGIRYDYTNYYHGKWSPSLGMQYQINPKLLFKMGTGAGFKSPDYKMLYQVFFNPNANYYVVGSDRVREVVDGLLTNGTLNTSNLNMYMVNEVAGNLKAERSWSNNAGFIWQPSARVNSEITLFYHRISNQINPVPLTTGFTNVGLIYSYRNLPVTENKGFEAVVNYAVLPNLQLSAGYQYLIAKDLSVLDSIRADELPYNQIYDAEHAIRRKSTVKDYWGIENRSRHMLNLKALYTIQPWNVNINVRATIRGKYPFQDTNLNQFIDAYDAFVPVHTLLNATIEKKLLKDHLTLRLVGDNLFNFVHQYMPGQVGRTVLGGFSYRWF